jgi:hypothetical protein
MMVQQEANCGEGREDASILTGRTKPTHSCAFFFPIESNFFDKTLNNSSVEHFVYPFLCFLLQLSDRINLCVSVAFDALPGYCIFYK